jgi:F-type H+-transporting ATPase subunit b
MKRLLLVAALACAALVAQTPEESKPGEPAGSAEPAAIWKWANFAILAVGLGYLMAKHLPPFFQSRSGEIQKGIAEAQQIKLDAEKHAAEMEARLKALGADIEKFRAQASAEMHQEGERIRQETAAQIQRLEEHAAVEIESAGKAARRELKRYAADLSLDLAEQRIRGRLDGPAEAALADRFVSDLERQGSAS